MPRVPRHAVNKILETEEQEVGQSDPRIVRSNGPAKASLAPPSSIETADRPVDKEWAEMVAFSRELITIVINESTDPTAENPVFCANNGSMPPVDGGRPGWLFRGKEYTIERRFVESLARAKITTYSQKRETDPHGIPHVINIPHTACRYPFRVVNDPHPRGADWLKSILLEPA